MRGEQVKVGYSELMERCRRMGEDSHELARRGGKKSAKTRARKASFKKWNEQETYWNKKD